MRSSGRVHRPVLILSVVGPIVIALAGCGGIASPSPIQTVGPLPASPITALPPRSRTPEVARCADGRLTVGDLREVDETWAEGVTGATERALAWQADARLVSLQVGCQPLEPLFRWRGTFYSDSAQAFFFSDTGQAEPAEVDPASVPVLPQERLSFRQLQLSLARAGYADGTLLSAAGGVTVRLNDPIDPFGPPGTPEDVVFHVAIDENGAVRDLFVSAATWTIHSYKE